MPQKVQNYIKGYLVEYKNGGQETETIFLASMRIRAEQYAAEHRGVLIPLIKEPSCQETSSTGSPLSSTTNTGT